jgi:hypothetical protein
MPINQTNQVDYLFKKIGYSVAKTDTTTAKSPSNETIASPLNLRGDVIWQQSGLIPATQPSSSTGVVTVYSDANSNTVKTTADSTSTTYRTWKTGITGWINPSFGATYSVKVYWDSTSAISPQTSGTQLFPDGTGNDDEWFFDYDAGVLTFPDNIPTTVAAGGTKTIYIVGAVYNGIIGIGNINANTIVGTLATANVGLYANVLTTSTNFNYYPILGNIFGGNTQHFVSSAITLNASTGNLTVGNVTATQFNGSLIGPVSTPTQTLITTVGTLTNLTVAGNTTTNNLLVNTVANVVGNIITQSNVITNYITTGSSTGANLVIDPDGNGDVVFPSQTELYINSTAANAVVVAGGVGIAGNVTSGNLTTTTITATSINASGNVKATNVNSTFYGNVHADSVTAISGNLTLSPLASNIVVINTTSALLLPSGTQAQRPGTPTPGEIRYNSDALTIEWWNGAMWMSVSNAIQYQQFSGNGVAQSFNLNFPADQNSIIVNINGTMQIPGTAYTVNNQIITFSEPPLSTDKIDLRFIAVPLIDVLGNGMANSFSFGNTSTYIPPQSLGIGDSPTFAGVTINGNIINNGNLITTNGIFWANGTAWSSQGGSGTIYSNANVTSFLTSGGVTANVIYGNILPAANVIYSLGSAQYQWKDLWVSNSTIYIGGVAIKANAQGNTLTINNNLISGQIKYSKQSLAPTNPNIGDQWYDTDTDVLYEYLSDGTTTTWVDITGPFGVAGIQGNIGPQGPAGNDGTSVIILGSVATFGALPSWGNLVYGDGFIVQNTGNLAVYDGSQFQDVGTIKGPKGDTGAQGPQGIQGIQGNVGPAGTNGINGTNYLNFGNITANANLNLVTGTLNFLSSAGIKIDINDANDTANVYLDPNGNINVYSVTSRFAENVITGTVPSSYTPDWNAGTIHNYTAIQNFTLNAPINMPVGGSMTIVVTQDSNGSRAMTANSYYKFASNIKTLSTGANSVDMMNFVRTGANTYLTVLTKGYA